MTVDWQDSTLSQGEGEGEGKGEKVKGKRGVKEEEK